MIIAFSDDGQVMLLSSPQTIYMCAVKGRALKHEGALIGSCRARRGRTTGAQP